MIRSSYLDLNPNYNIQDRQTDHLKTISKQQINQYTDSNTFNIGTFINQQYSHTGSNPYFIQVLNEQQDEVNHKIFIFGKFKVGGTTSNIEVIYSNSKVSGSPPGYIAPTDLVFGETIRGTLKPDGFFHFIHTVNVVPKYISFYNPNLFDLTETVIHYVKLI